MTTKSIFIVFLSIVSFTAFSQQIGNGQATYLSNFSTPLLSGFYQGNNPNGQTPDNSNLWQHLITLRHSNLDNNHQLQIGSSYTENDRLFFRKFATGLGATNPLWIEIATRGSNTFTGNQILNGNLGIGTTSPTENISIFSNNARLSVSGQSGSSAILLGNRDSGGVNNPAAIYAANGNLFFGGGNNWDKGGVLTATMIVSDYGNVGIGTQNPDEKLTVKGKIHAEEIKVDLLVPADYVFQKYYTGKSSLKEDYVMPTLAEIESFTKENNHLPNIPSAQEMKDNGLELGKMNNLLLQKIEELTLYVIEQQKEIQLLKEKINK